MWHVQDLYLYIHIFTCLCVSGCMSLNLCERVYINTHSKISLSRLFPFFSYLLLNTEPPPPSRTPLVHSHLFRPSSFPLSPSYLLPSHCAGLISIFMWNGQSPEDKSYSCLQRMVSQAVGSTQDLRADDALEHMRACLHTVPTYLHTYSTCTRMHKWHMQVRTYVHIWYTYTLSFSHSHTYVQTRTHTCTHTHTHTHTHTNIMHT